MEEKLTRREVREGAFILLYQTMFGQPLGEIIEADEESLGLARNNETDAIVRGVMAHDEELTAYIAKYSTTRSVARISKVNLVLMKIAIYEMKYNDKVPGLVVTGEIRYLTAHGDVRKPAVALYQHSDNAVDLGDRYYRGFNPGHSRSPQGRSSARRL